VDFKNQGKKSAKTRKLCLLRAGKQAENQRKTREKSKVAENPSVLVGFLRQKKGLNNMHTPSGIDEHSH